LKFFGQTINIFDFFEKKIFFFPSSNILILLKKTFSIRISKNSFFSWLFGAIFFGKKLSDKFVWTF
jgi:hypothetical protein